MFCYLLTLSVSLGDTFGLNVTFKPDGRGSTYLKWESIGEDFLYSVYRKDEGKNEWNPIKNFYKGKKIKVLNIYPGKHSEDCKKGYCFYDYEHSKVIFKFNNGTIISVYKSAALKIWMEGGTIIENNKLDHIQGEGYDENTKEQLIQVDLMSVAEFENQKEKIYDYDCVYIGSWDSNDGISVSTNTASGIIKEYIDKGNAFILTHGLEYHAWNNEGMSRIRHTFGITHRILDKDYSIPLYVSNQNTGYIKISKVGILTEYPHILGNLGDEIVVPQTHSVDERVSGDVWFYLSRGANVNIPNINEKAYLSIKGNVALIQTGHSFCKSTETERKIIANLIYYLTLKTQTNSTSFEDLTSFDTTPPEVSLNCDLTVKIKWEGKDFGTKYTYFVEGKVKNEIKKTKEFTIDAISGLKEYIYVINQEEHYNISNTKNEHHTNETIYNFHPYQKGLYFHISAIDNAGNIGKTKTCKIKPMPTQTPLDPQDLSNIPGIVVEKVSMKKQYLIIGVGSGFVVLFVISGLVLHKKFSVIEADFEFQYKNGLNLKNSTVNYQNPLYDNNSIEDPFQDDFN